MSPDESTKDRVYSYIWSNPGAYFREILYSLAIGNGSLQYTLATLEQEGKITVTRIGTFKHFYPNEKFEEGDRNILGILSQESPRKILIFLAGHPGSSQSEVAKHIGYSSPTARWYLLRLEAIGLVWSRRDRTKVRYYANSSLPEIVALMKKYKPRIWNKLADNVADMMRTFGDSKNDG